MSNDATKDPSPELSRDTGPFKNRYFIRAKAYWITPPSGPSFVHGNAEVFDGRPNANNDNGFFRTWPDTPCDNLLGIVENVERIAREHIARL